MFLNHPIKSQSCKSLYFVICNSAKKYAQNIVALQLLLVSDQQMSDYLSIRYFTLYHSYANQMLIIYNVRCNDDERIYFNITWQDIQPRNCGDPPVYVTTIMYITYYLSQYLHHMLQA